MRSHSDGIISLGKGVCHLEQVIATDAKYKVICRGRVCCRNRLVFVKVLWKRDFITEQRRKVLLLAQGPHQRINSRVHFPTENMIADLLMKPLEGEQFRRLRRRLLNWDRKTREDSRQKSARRFIYRPIH